MLKLKPKLILVSFAGLVLFFSLAPLVNQQGFSARAASGLLLAENPPANPPPANPPPTDDCASQGLKKADNGLCLPEAPIHGGFADSASVGDFIIKVITILLVLSGVIAVLFVVIGGFQYVTSGGNEESAKKGKKTLTNAVIGIVVVVLAYAIINVAVNTLTSGTIFGGSSVGDSAGFNGSPGGSSGFFQQGGK